MATYTFPVHIHDNHLIADFGDYTALLDTGAPVSISLLPEIQFCGITIHPLSDYMGQGVESVQQMVGHPFDVLMGLDCLATCYWQIEGLESENPQLTICDSPQMASPESSIATQQIIQPGTFPVIGMSIEGHDIRAYFDTGAKMGYVNSENLLFDDRPYREATDFSPLFGGEFETKVRDFDVSIGPLKTNLPLGELPAPMNIFWDVYNVNAILGVDLLRHVSVEFALPEEKIHFGPCFNI